MDILPFYRRLYQMDIQWTEAKLGDLPCSYTMNQVERIHDYARSLIFWQNPELSALPVASASGYVFRRMAGAFATDSTVSRDIIDLLLKCAVEVETVPETAETQGGADDKLMALIQKVPIQPGAVVALNMFRHNYNRAKLGLVAELLDAAKDMVEIATSQAPCPLSESENDEEHCVSATNFVIMPPVRHCVALRRWLLIR